MKAVMWDLIRADQYVSEFLIKDSTKKKKTELAKYYDEIFQLHGITEQQFKQSLDHYSSSPNLFRPIIDSIVKQQSEAKPYFAPGPGKITKDSMMKRRIPKPLPVR
jgi:pantothenate kinase type III